MCAQYLKELFQESLFHFKPFSFTTILAIQFKRVINLNYLIKSILEFLQFLQLPQKILWPVFKNHKQIIFSSQIIYDVLWDMLKQSFSLLAKLMYRYELELSQGKLSKKMYVNQLVFKKILSVLNYIYISSFLKFYELLRLALKNHFLFLDLALNFP